MNLTEFRRNWRFHRMMWFSSRLTQIEISILTMLIFIKNNLTLIFLSLYPNRNQFFITGTNIPKIQIYNMICKKFINFNYIHI